MALTRLQSIGVSLAICSYASLGRAQALASATPDAPPAGHATRHEPARWYGWQTLTADAAALGLAFGSASARSRAGVTAAAVTYLVGAPVIDGASGEGGNGGMSVGARLGLPLLGAVVASAVADCPPERGSGFNFGPSCEDAAAIQGVAYGILAAMVIDGTAIAWTRRTSEVLPEKRDAPRAVPRPKVAPWLGWKQGGVSGQF